MEDRGPFRSYAGRGAASIRNHFQRRIRDYCTWIQRGTATAPLGVRRMTEHVTDAFTLLHKVSEVRDLHDVVRVQTEFVQKKIDMFNDRTRGLSGVTRAAGNVVDAVASLMQLRKLSEDIARNSPKYEPAEPEDARADSTHRTFRARS